MGKSLSSKQVKREVKTRQIHPWLFTGILLTLFFAIALILRIYLPYNQVFTPDWIKFTGNDAYFQMRLVDTMVNNFPHFASFDPYLQYPGGVSLGQIQFFNWLLASITWVIGLGSPTERTVDAIGAYFPAVLGALAILPVYFAGKELFGRWAGLLSAALVAILPSEFLGRSILGFTDQHVAETLLTATAMLFLVVAIKSARQKELTFIHLARWDWAINAKPLLYSLLAGVFFGLYILTWAGALLFVFVVCAYLLVQFAIDHLRRRSTDYLSFTGAIFFLVPLLMAVPASPGTLTIGSLGVALLIPLALGGLSRLMTWKGLRQAYYPVAVVGLGLAGATILYVASPSLFRSMLDAFSIFAPPATLRTTIEAQPFLVLGGKFSLAIAWGNFTTCFFLGMISLVILTYLVVRRGDPDKTLLVVWSLVILAATLAQRRFAYYFVVNVALLTGYLSVLVYSIIRFIIDYLRGKSTAYMSWQILEFASFEELVARPEQLSTRAERKKAKRLERKEAKRLQRGQARRGNEREARFRPTIAHVTISLWVIAVFFLAFFPNIVPAIVTASVARFAPSDAWCSALTWLRDNTAEPFGDPAAYYRLHKAPLPGEAYKYPESAYGVMAWWDYGYWITRIGHRIPNANPGQDPNVVTNIAAYFTAQDESSANEIAQKMGSAYVIMDYETATSKFWAVATWAGREQAEFFDIYWAAQGNQQKLLFHPEYYRSLAVRLYNFDGKAVTPGKSLVIAYQERVSPEGIRYKKIISEKQFDSYEEAEAYISSQKSGNYKIVGTDPLISPVPLEALKYYKLVYASEESVTVPGAGKVPAVKIFEFMGRDSLYRR